MKEQAYDIKQYVDLYYKCDAWFGKINSYFLTDWLAIKLVIDRLKYLNWN